MSIVSAFLSQVAPGSTGVTSGAAKFFELWDVSVTKDGAIRAGIVIGVVFVVSLLLKRIFTLVGRRMTHANPLASSVFVAVSHSTHLLLFAMTVRGLVPSVVEGSTSAFGLDLGPWARVSDRSASVLLVVAFTVAVLHLVRVPVTWFKAFADKTESKLDDMLVPVVDTALRVLVIIGGVIQVIASLSGSQPAQVVAPLAVGGLAIGLAAQDTVKNFFGAVMLIIDKPFTLGDFVNVGTHSGTVESLGLRSTRLRTPDGHLVSVPNGDLANRAIQNVTMRRYIRQVITIGVTYDTTSAKLEEALEILKQLLVEHEGFDPAFPPRVHFEKMADWSLNLQVIYWYHPGDYWAFMNFNQRLQLDILSRFERAGIAIAFPTQTVIGQGFPLPPTMIPPAR
jgi:MscS family membrane protein